MKNVHFFHSMNTSQVCSCKFGVSSVSMGTAGHAETTSTTQGLSKLQAQELILRLNGEERNVLMTALHEYQSKLVKDEYEAASVPRPTTKNLIDIGIANSIPFIGFGFLDNFFMLFFGDYIDLYLGSYFCLSTMGAAALGNTLSDIMGIGSAFYVERLANRIGFTPPKLSPIQLDMNCCRNSANAGRVLGVTLGCLLGMCPLLFRRKEDTEEKEDG
ncbi:transmembrane protein 65 isoform X5 [Diorhabda carinulata]|uniref:transmembrane protein 65 isoform X5 n=1 Tax=Diorhabda carinulata TaxID=1163345 RepID=UPI0025A19864|nr:transmembrane protein 65 isoform X5 [Diorhabda carinulata]